MTAAAGTRWKALMERWQGRRVLVLGDLMLDEYLWGSVSRISPEAPVPIVEITDHSFRPGGAANVACNVAVLGGKVEMCGVVGNDIMGQTLLSALRGKDVGCDGVMLDDERPTTVKTRIIAAHQQVVRADREKRGAIGPAITSRLADFVEGRLAGLAAIVLEDYDKGVLSPALIARVVSAARKADVPVLVDPKVEHLMNYRGVTLLKPNLRETEQATGEKLADEAAVRRAGERLLRELKCEAVLVTAGERGMTLCVRPGAKGKSMHVPAQAREVADVTGAGDTVISVVALAVAAGASFDDAAWIASYAAGVKLGKLGAAPVSVAEIRDAVERS